MTKRKTILEGLVVGAAIIFLSSCQTFTPLSHGAKVKIKTTSAGLEYAVLTFPPNDSAERFPVIVALRGKGTDFDETMSLWEREASERRVMVIVPDWDNWDLKGEKKKTGANLDDLALGLDEILKQYPEADQSRLVIAGVSAGGLVAQWMISVNPSKWKAAVFVSYASAKPWWSKMRANEIPAVLFMHGKQDEQFSTALVTGNSRGLELKGSKVKVIEAPEAGHEHRPEWTKQILDWLDTIWK